MSEASKTSTGTLLARVKGLPSGLGWGILGTAFLCLALAPTFLVPLYTDDFKISQGDYYRYQGSLSNAVLYSWDTWQSNRFSPVGRWLVHIHSTAAHDFSSQFGIDMHWWYRTATLVFVWFAVLAAAYAAQRVAGFMGEKSLGLWSTFAAIAGVLAITLQLHPWNQDPSLAIADVGWVTAALFFLLTGLAMRSLNEDLSLKSAVVPVVLVTLTSVLYYELLVGAVAGLSIVYAWVFWTSPRDSRQRLKAKLLITFAVVLPALVFILGRMWVGSLDLPTYPGTEPALRAEGLKPFFILLTSAFPGSAWPLSVDYAGAIKISMAALLTSFLTALLLVGVANRLRRSQVNSLAFGHNKKLVLSASLVMFLSVIAINSFTEKYIREIVFLGEVYLSYPITLLFVSLLILALIFSLKPKLASIVFIAVIPISTSWVVVQHSANWSVATVAAEKDSRNRDITRISVSDEYSEAQRCEALRPFLVNKGNPSDSMRRTIEALYWNYRHDFGQIFCSSIDGRSLEHLMPEDYKRE